MHANKSIRDAVKAQIAAIYTAGKVFTDRTFDTRNNDSPESVQVYLQRGADEGADMVAEYRTELKVVVRKSGIAHDDELDAIAIVVHGALGADTSLGGLVAGLAYEGFEYLDDDAQEFSALLINYTVIY